MRKVMVAAVTGMLRSSRVIGSSEEGAGTIGKQIGNTAEKAIEATSNAMEKTTEASIPRC
jgi:hypothetical protein